MASVNPGRSNIHTHSAQAFTCLPALLPGSVTSVYTMRSLNQVQRLLNAARHLFQGSGSESRWGVTHSSQREEKRVPTESTQCPGGFCAGVETPAARTLSIPPVPHRQPHPETEQSSPERWPRPPLRATRVRVTDTGAGGGHVPGSEATVSCRSSGPAVMLQPCVGNGPPGRRCAPQGGHEGPPGQRQHGLSRTQRAPPHPRSWPRAPAPTGH